MKESRPSTTTSLLLSYLSILVVSLSNNSASTTNRTSVPILINPCHPHCRLNRTRTDHLRSRSWLHLLLVRWLLPFICITTTCTTTPLSLGLHHHNNNNNNNRNNNDHNIGGRVGANHHHPVGLGILHNILDNTLRQSHKESSSNSSSCSNIRSNQTLVNTTNTTVHHPSITSLGRSTILIDPNTTKNQNEKSNRFIEETQQTHDATKPLKPLNGSNNSNNNSNSNNSDTNKGEDKKTKKKQKMIRLPTGEQLSEEDQKFHDRVQSSLRTVQHWEEDTKLFQHIRDTVIPWDDLRNHTGPYSNQDDRLFVQQDALFLQRLCRWFPKFMSWVNTPLCVKCGCKECEMKTVRPPETDEERDGNAKRVEVYYCPQCKENTTTFPRYNKASKLLETRRGRCGEYSNLFGLFCRSVGFETRLVLDLSDHLWTEVRLGDSWIMADACEGIIDKPSMYEYGWGKSGLCYMMAIGHDEVVDVTPRYTRAFLTDEFQTRRREHTTSEEMSSKIIQYLNQDLQKKMTKTRAEEVARRKKMEDAELNHSKQLTEWTDNEKYGRGRISGSFAWKKAREETGNNQHQQQQQRNNDSDTNSTKLRRQVAGFDVETFYPPRLDSGTITFRLNGKPSSRHDGIIVSKTACAVGEANAISVVVVDDKSFGCILQSKSFVAWPDVVRFIDSLPSDRLILMNGKIEIGNETKPEDFYKEVVLKRLGGWNGKHVVEKGVLFAGQIDAHPDWAFFSTIEDSDTDGGFEIELEPVQYALDSPRERLRTERATIPTRVAGRIPEAFMPLKTQTEATETQKRTAFLSFLQSNIGRYCGYTSKSNCPIYLLDSASYPLQRMDKTMVEDIGKENTWNTFINIPEPLVPKDDAGIENTSQKIFMPNYEVPLDSSFFDSSIGPNLLTDVNTRVQTSDALQNTRLVGLYFSAHWCGPCRSFTPMLSEMYDHLSDIYPSHGLKIVFVSGDRDEQSFRNYYQSMPWCAIPFDQLSFYKQALNMTYGVRGIPSFVVLDAVSGQVVVPASQSRQEVVNACRGGELQIEAMLESWLSRIPASSQELLSMLELSTQEDLHRDGELDHDDNPYLRRTVDVVNGDHANAQQADLSARIRAHFDRLVHAGQDPNSAAATALKMVTEGVNPPGPLNGKALYRGAPRPKVNLERLLGKLMEWNVASSIANVLSTAQKYLKNALKEPWEPKFRSFKLSNKVADTVTRVEGGWTLLEALGFEVVGTSQDFKAHIPVSADLRSMDESITQLMQQARTVAK
ncbi:thioredoxin-like protein [Nitzschia inconspicua]|uniref:Thioredoxin-like protein n=1 Tax=Nitzschia inconspicua TaxID=303405 RepID=A0A9K3LKX1_9STRA|nr:thioredoxin-like protein [Nitzschia inconspicua]